MAPQPPLELYVDPTAQQDVLILPTSYPPNTLPGDLIAVRPVLSASAKGKGRDKPLLFKVDKPPELDAGEKDGLAKVGLGAQRRGKASVTVSPTVAQGFGWVKNRCEVELSRIPSPPPRNLTATHVELYFNNMYLSRPDSFQLSLALVGKVLHTGQRVVLPGSGARLRVGDMYSAAAPRSSPSSSRTGGASSSSSSSPHQLNARLAAAYVTDETKFVFRSESARHYVFVEVSQELWQFEEDGSMLLEKAELFLHELFAHYSGKMTRDAEDKRSKGIPTSHMQSIILYGRVIYDDADDAEEARAPLQRLENGTLYRDFYKVLLDLQPVPSASIIRTVALELRRWQSTVLLRTLADGSEKLSGRLAHAHESPVLEATNLALNSFEEHWIDRDLQRTGLEIVVMTAGSSFYQVEKSLLRLTTERMLYHGIGLDLISLSKMPLHTVPLFQFRSPDPQAAEVSLAVREASAGATIANQNDLRPGTFYPNSHRSAANFGPHRASPRYPHGPSSLRERGGAGPLSRSPALRDPHLVDPAADAASTASRLPPVQVPDDQRDPLYFDSPAPRNARPQDGPVRSHARILSAANAASLAVSPAFPSSSAPSYAPSVSSSVAPGTAPPLAGGLETSLYYAEPLFVFPHFFGTQLDKPHRIDRFMPRARCYELFVQGVTERAPIAIPLLPPLAGGGAGAVGSEGGAGYLSELERRMQRREAYDAAAVGARDPAELEAGGEGAQVWELRESGALTGSASGGSLSASASAAPGAETPSESEEAVSTSSEVDGEDGSVDAEGDGGMLRANALGLGLPVAGGRADSLRSLSLRRVRTRDRGSSVSTSTSTLAAGPVEGDERGRRPSRSNVQEHTPQSGRSKTPVPSSAARREGSVAPAPGGRSRAGSIRTISSLATDARPAKDTLSGRKASTPALIARLTGSSTAGGSPSSTASSSSTTLQPPPSPAPAAAASATAAAPSRSSWLSLFGRTTTASSILSTGSASATTPSQSPSYLAPPSAASSAAGAAPQVAVARVDVQANLKPDWASPPSTTSELPDELSGPTSTVLGFSTASQRPSSRSRTRAEAVRSATTRREVARTQPISIGAKMGGAEEKRGTGGDRPAAAKEVATSQKSGKGMSSSSLKQYELDGSSGVRRAFGLGSGVQSGRISVAERFNPSKPGKRSVGLADQARRWAGIAIAERRSMKLGVKWRSLTRGACLPITTDYLPSSEALSTQYSEYRYTVPTASVTSSAFLRTDHPKRSHTLTLVTELICQRLSQGFQICTPADASGALDAVNFATAKTLPDVLRDIQEGEVTAVYLSLSNQVHRIWYDRRTSSVFVKILRRRRTWAKSEYGYKPLIWSSGQDNYDQISRLAFPYPEMIEPVEWQHVDRLVAGAEKPDAHQSVRYRRTRLLLLPASKVPDREYIVSVTKALQGGEASDAIIQAQGFYALMDLVENARWAPAGVEKEPLAITQTSLDAPGWAASVAQAQAADAVSASPSVVPVQHPRTTWLSRMQGRTKGSDDALGTPPPPLERDLEHPPPLTATPGKDAVAALNRSDTSTSLATITGPAGNGSTPSPHRPVVQMTHAVVLDFDPSKRSDRSERVLCHLDRSHNVQAAYHVELTWLTASGKMVDNAIQSWSRQMARYGLNLVEVSTRPVLQRHNPFEHPAIIRLAVLPPSAKVEVDDEEEGVRKEQEKPSKTEHYLSLLLRSLNYFLDLGADSTFPSSIDVQYSYRRTPTLRSQFVHQSGSLLVSIFEDEDGPGFAYAPNRIHTSHHPEIEAAQTVQQLAEVCADDERLSAFWRNGSKPVIGRVAG
ncbi:hypothetical protein JCM10213_003083 [Rhodosporidiobolus nylandii]